MDFVTGSMALSADFGAVVELFSEHLQGVLKGLCGALPGGWFTGLAQLFQRGLGPRDRGG
jgi:hypothetical protein